MKNPCNRPARKLDLLVIQPTPFCNLDCDYCYLPNRQSKERIQPHVLRRLFERVFESDLVAEEFTVVWHAGEPFGLPIFFYHEAFEIIRGSNRLSATSWRDVSTLKTLSPRYL